MAIYANGTASAVIKSGVGKVYGIIVNSHSSGTLRLNDGGSGTTSAGVKATGVLTGTGVFSNGETITVDETVYTMKTALTNLVANEVLIGASLAISLDNLKSAINDSGTEGTHYSTGTVAHPTVTATTNTDTAWGAVVLENGAVANFLAMNTFTVPTGSYSLIFAEKVDFTQGIYLTVGGTIDYTVLYA